ncbi:hypothetical protein Tco_0967219 [Tanacetum coccineum]
MVVRDHHEVGALIPYGVDEGLSDESLDDDFDVVGGYKVFLTLSSQSTNLREPVKVGWGKSTKRNASPGQIRIADRRRILDGAVIGAIGNSDDDDGQEIGEPQKESVHKMVKITGSEEGRNVLGRRTSTGESESESNRNHSHTIQWVKRQ